MTLQIGVVVRPATDRTSGLNGLHQSQDQEEETQCTLEYSPCH